MTEIENEASRNYNILVCGIDKKSLTLLSKEIVDRNFKLVFEPFKTQKRFDDYDGAILFQGIFESFKAEPDGWGDTHQRLMFDKDELDKRTKELGVLLKKGGFLACILCEPIYDHLEGDDVSSTDLAKICLNSSRSLHRENFSNRVTEIQSKQNELHKFIERFGAPNTYFDCYDKNFDMKVIAASASDKAVGIILMSQLFFVPALRVDNIPDRISEYFQLLAEAVTSVFNKLLVEIPEWVNHFKFGQEVGLLNQRTELISKVEKTQAQIKELQRYKSVLIHGGGQKRFRLTSEATLALVDTRFPPQRLTLGGDKNYNTTAFVDALRIRQETPHVATHTTNRASAMDGRTTRQPGYAVSQQKRTRAEEVFGWLKTVGLLRKVKLRGVRRIDWLFTVAAAAYNLVRMRNRVERAV